MQDNYSLAKAEQRARKEDDVTDSEDQKTASGSAAAETKFLNFMSQYEMEILTTLFPKCAETLAGVLHNRQQLLDDEL